MSNAHAREPYSLEHAHPSWTRPSPSGGRQYCRSVAGGSMICLSEFLIDRACWMWGITSFQSIQMFPFKKRATPKPLVSFTTPNRWLRVDIYRGTMPNDPRHTYGIEVWSDCWNTPIRIAEFQAEDAEDIASLLRRAGAYVAACRRKGN